jgi:hypothetical protein
MLRHASLLPSQAGAQRVSQPPTPGTGPLPVMEHTQPWYSGSLVKIEQFAKGATAIFKRATHSIGVSKGASTLGRIYTL